MHDYAGAAAAYHRALADHPENRHLHQGYAYMLREWGDTAGARRQFELAGVAPVARLFTP
jgi:Flp pilus assembly protein TadD